MLSNEENQAPAAPPAAEPAAAAAVPSTGPSWEDIVKGLPEDLRGDASLGSIKSVDGLVKSYISAQKMVGGNLKIPDPKHATQDDYLEVFKKLGAVENPDDFKFKLPEGLEEDAIDAESMAKLKTAAVKSGVLPWQFEEIFNAYYDSVNSKVGEHEAAAKAQADSDMEGLKKEWGDGFDTQVRKANVVFKELIPDEGDRNRLIDDGLGGHPVVMKLLLNASKFMKEDVFLGQGSGEFSGFTPEKALSRAREIQGDATHPYRTPTHPNHAAAKKEVADLYKVAFPE